MGGTILHIMNYAASYRGNFIDSLEFLNQELEADGLKNIYLFTKEARLEGPMTWIKEMERRGQKVEFLSEHPRKDAAHIKQLIKAENVKIIHTHFITMAQYLSVYSATMFLKIPVIMHMHNHSRELKNPLKGGLRHFLYSKCIMLACSESVYRSLERDYPQNKKNAIDNGVNFSRLDSYREMKHQEFGFEEEEKVFLIFGFDFYRKGVDLAIRALKGLRDKGHLYSLIISLSTNFEEVEKNITGILGEMPGWVKVIPARNDVATLYNSVDLFLSPSREEGLPYSVVEAAYSKCSVVLSDISAQVNLKIPFGYLFESENIETFQKQIINAVEDHHCKLEDWENVKTQMKKNYALDAWSKKVADFYRSCLNS